MDGLSACRSSFWCKYSWWSASPSATSASATPMCSASTLSGMEAPSCPRSSRVILRVLFFLLVQVFLASFFVGVIFLDFDGQMSKATESFELEKNYPLANGQVDHWVMTHALCAAGKCSVWSGGSILSSVFTVLWSYTHDYDESGPQSSGLRSGTQTTICASIFFLSLSLSVSLCAILTLQTQRLLRPLPREPYRQQLR